jgi:hypothetical protein
MPKKLKSKKEYEYEPHVPGKPFGPTEDLEHWSVLMHEWANQVNDAVHKLEKHCKIEKNPDDPPEPPWGFG